MIERCAMEVELEIKDIHETPNNAKVSFNIEYQLFKRVLIAGFP